MILSIKLSDETYEKYGKLNPQNPRYAVERVAEKYADVGYSAKAIVVHSDVLARLQTLLGRSLDDPTSLEEAVRDAVSIKVDGVDVALTESQRKGIQSMAHFFAQDPAEFAKAKIKQGLMAVLGV